MEKEMATHSSVIAWRIPGTREPGGLPSMGSHRVRHDWSDSAAAPLFCSFPTPLSTGNHKYVLYILSINLFLLYWFIFIFQILTYSIVFLCLSYFTKHNTFQVHPCCCKWQNFVPFVLSNIAPVLNVWKQP